MVNYGADPPSSVAEYLQPQGCTVTQAADGWRLRAILACEAIDLVLLDLRMPGKDGLALLRRVRGIVYQRRHAA